MEISKIDQKTKKIVKIFQFLSNRVHTQPLYAAVGKRERSANCWELLAIVDKRSREEKIRISELAVVSLWSLWTGRKLGPVAMWLTSNCPRRTSWLYCICSWISFFGLPIKSYSGLRPLVYKKYTLKEPDSRLRPIELLGCKNTKNKIK